MTYKTILLYPNQSRPVAKQDFADAVQILEEQERLRAEQEERERIRREEERARELWENLTIEFQHAHRLLF